MLCLSLYGTEIAPHVQQKVIEAISSMEQQATHAASAAQQYGPFGCRTQPPAVPARYQQVVDALNYNNQHNYQHYQLSWLVNQISSKLKEVENAEPFEYNFGY